ncbi:MAG: RNB domain-containing ribonuclease, partial [Chloroflexi bacterium]
MTLPQNALVLYKHNPARVLSSGDKIEIVLADGRQLKVRPKDVILLHPGPFQSFADLHPPDGDIETAWELLAGSQTTLPELAELIYSNYTPATAWAVWQLVADGLYFRGQPDNITALPPDEVARQRADRARKEAEEAAWHSFLQRLEAGHTTPDDAPFLRDVEDLALGRQSKSRILRHLGRTQSPENAHALLLELGFWDETVNPYPIRFGLPLDPPQAGLPPLPDEPRLDLTHLPAFAIDDEGSSDPDDALSLDGDRLWVHVADPAAVVSPDSPADLEARARAAKLYLPECTVPMLPPEATERLALGLSEVSPALSFGFTLTGDGEISGLEITPSWVRVQRLTYEEAETRLSDPPLAGVLRLARQFRDRRLANGAVEIDLPEVKIRLVEGQVVIKPLLPLQSRMMVREAMLMAGEAVARFAEAHGIPLPFTTQDAPDLESAGPLPEGMAGMFALRRLMTRSQLSSVPGPHAGLGLARYAQATSPLRRYLDLVMHQQLRAWLKGQPLLDAGDILERVGMAESVTGSVRQVERLSNKHWTLVYLQRLGSWQGEAVLVDRRDLRG